VGGGSWHSWAGAPPPPPHLLFSSPRHACNAPAALWGYAEDEALAAVHGDKSPPRSPSGRYMAFGAFGATFLLQGISQLLHIDWLTYLAFQILGQQVETLSVDVFLVWCSATLLLMSHGKVKLFGICVMAVAVSAEIYSYGVRYFGSGAGGVSPLLKLVLLLPFAWLLLESSKKIPLPEAAKKA
jgi:hypothetical protein